MRDLFNNKNILQWNLVRLSRWGLALIFLPGAKQFLFPIPDMMTWDSKETAGKSEADYKALLGADLNKKIVIYCGFVKCARSHNGAMWAKKMGYKNVSRFSGGIFAWKGAGFKTESVQ